MRLAAVPLVVLVAAGPVQVPAAAQSAADDRAAAKASATYVDRRLGELRRMRTRLEAEQAGLRRGIAANDVRRDLLTTKLEELEAILSAAQRRLASAEARFRRVRDELKANERSLRQLERSLERTVSAVEARAVDIYKRGSVSVVEMVVGARNVGDLLRRFAYVLRISQIDTDRVADMQDRKNAIVEARAIIHLLRQDAAKKAAQLRAERDRVAGVTRHLRTERAAVGSELKAQYARLGSIAQQKKRFDAEARQLRAESGRIAAFLRGQSDTPPTVSRKGMSWPVFGPVTSGFGWRRHPVLGGTRFHAGIDISAPTGTSVRSAASGKVIFAGSQTGYGNYVIIYHGGRIATLYGHLSSIGVAAGTQVLRRQTIGRVGCTGYCTGSHLHFEVRVNGNPVDPMGWLP